jgi:phosphoribosylformylglycinamidine cyclo-ligase
LKHQLEQQNDWDSWEMPHIFKMIQNAGNISDDEMRNVFNIGIGMIIVCDKNDANYFFNDLKTEHPFIMGEIV